MSDFLLELGQDPRARKVIKTLGIPLPIPQKLRRADSPWEERPLHDRDVVFATAGAGGFEEQVALTLCEGGANPFVIGDQAVLAAFQEPGEAHGRPARKT